MNIFNDAQLKKANKIIQEPNSKLSTLTRSEINDLAIVWSYYFAKIEGITYTLGAAEALLNVNITAEKRYE